VPFDPSSNPIFCSVQNAVGKDTIMDYKSLSAEELVAALAETNEKAKALFALEAPTIEQADEAEALAATKLAIETVQAERAQAVKDAEAKFAKARESFSVDAADADGDDADAADDDDDADDADADDDADDADADDDADDADADDDAGDDAADADAEAEALAASAKHTKSQTITPGKAPVKAAAKSGAKAVAKRNKRPEVKKSNAVTITAAADVPGFATGSTLDDMSQVTKAAMGRVKAFQPWNERSAQMVSKANGGVPELHKFGVAQFGVDFDPSMLAPSNPSPMNELAAIKAALAQDRFTGTAAGWCAPSENVYSFIADYVVDGLITVPEVGAPRGGLNLTTGPERLSQGNALDDFGFVQTEAEAIAQTVKNCETIVCPDFVDHRLDAIGYCFKIPFLTQKAYPELITDALRFANVLYAHKVNRYVIDAIVGLSDGVNAAPYGASFTDTLEALTIIAVKERRRWNLGANATMEVKLPEFAREVFRADLSRRNAVAYDSVSEGQIASHFSDRNLAVEYVADWQELGGPDAMWAGSFQALIYPAGTFIKAVEDVVNLSAVYDAASLSINEYTGVFFEQGILVAKAGYGSSIVTIPVCTAGTSGAAAFLCEGGSF
jgi:hypothetical protein